MKLDIAKAIIELMTENGLSEFEMEEDGVRISIKKTAPPAPAPASPALPDTAAAAQPPGLEEPEIDSDLEDVKAPFVGTFYNAPSPDSEPFVEVGAEIEPDSVLCIIEAMKVMNEIKAETRGIVREILVQNACPVQYGQPLFRIEKL